MDVLLSRRVVGVSSSFLEIIELSSGEYVLRRAGGEGEPLVNIRFSDESKAYINDAAVDIAKIMIQAGMEAVAELGDQREIIFDDTEAPVDHTVH